MFEWLRFVFDLPHPSVCRRESASDLWLSWSTSAEPTATLTPSTRRSIAGYDGVWQACRSFYDSGRHALLLNGLCFLLSGNGAHAVWNRGPLWTVESLLLEGQVRTSPPQRSCEVCIFQIVFKLNWILQMTYWKRLNKGKRVLHDVCFCHETACLVTS